MCVFVYLYSPVKAAMPYGGFKPKYHKRNLKTYILLSVQIYEYDLIRCAEYVIPKIKSKMISLGIFSFDLIGGRRLVLFFMNKEIQICNATINLWQCHTTKYNKWNSLKFTVCTVRQRPVVVLLHKFYDAPAECN